MVTLTKASQNDTSQKSLYRPETILYFDENFSQDIIDVLKLNKSTKKKLKIYSVYDFNNQGKDDRFLFSFCMKKRFVPVTLDRDFLDDKEYPIQKIPGIIVIVSGKKQLDKIKTCLKIVTAFLTSFPWPKVFMGDSKFRVSLSGSMMRGRDSITREIKTVFIRPGDSVFEVARKFSYLT